MFPKKSRYALNEGKEISLVPGLKRVRRELAKLKPDAILVFDTHWLTTVEFIITAQSRRRGKYTSEELPRGMRQIPYDLAGNPQFATRVAAAVTANGVKCYASDDPYLPVNYPTINLAHYLNAGEAWLSMGVCQTARDHHFLTVGEGIGEAIAASDQRVVLLASGGMSHRFWSLDELPQHEASHPRHIITPAARAADEQRIEWWQNGEHHRVIDAMDEYHQHKPEGAFGHYLMLVGALGGRACQARGERFSDYENATGTGQVHVWFAQPLAGW